MLFYKTSTDKWIWILEKLWKFSTTEDFYEWCSEIIDLSNDKNITLPSYDKLNGYIFNIEVNCGYGERFIGREHSLILM